MRAFVTESVQERPLTQSSHRNTPDILNVRDMACYPWYQPAALFDWIIPGYYENRGRQASWETLARYHNKPYTYCVALYFPCMFALLVALVVPARTKDCVKTKCLLCWLEDEVFGAFGLSRCVLPTPLLCGYPQLRKAQWCGQSVNLLMRSRLQPGSHLLRSCQSENRRSCGTEQLLGVDWSVPKKPHILITQGHPQLHIHPLEVKRYALKRAAAFRFRIVSG